MSRPAALAFVLSLLLLLLSIVPAASSYQSAASPFGVNSHIASRFTNYDVLHEPADMVASMGAGWVREDFHWFWIEPQPGVYQWAYYDRMVELFAARNVQIIGVLGHPPGWATPEPGDDPHNISFYGPDPQRFAEFAEQVVRRYKHHIVHWEIWNEPDNPQFWKPHPDPVAYAELLRTTYTHIRGTDPAATVLLGGVNPFDTRFLQALAANNAWWAFDVLNIHPYVDPAHPEAHGEIGLSALAALQEVTRWAGEKPIWVTEYGWSSRPSNRDPLGRISEEDQANYLVRGAVLLREAGAQRILWYSMKDERQNGYGMMRFAQSHDDYSQPRPAFDAFATLSEQLGSAHFERRLYEITPLTEGPVYALRFGTPFETIDVIWSITPATILLPTAQQEIEVINRDGNRWYVPAVGGYARLYPDQRPIYVRQPR
jgi:hypothetical protein